METPTRPPSPSRPRSPRSNTLTRRSSSRRENSIIDPLQPLLSDPSPGLAKKSSSKGLPLPGRKKSFRNRDLKAHEAKDGEKGARCETFGDALVDIFPGDNASDDVAERGRSKDRGPGKRSSTPFVRRRLSSLDDVDDDSDASEDMSSSYSSPRQERPWTRTASRGLQLPRRKNSRTRDVDGASRETSDREKGRRVNFAEGPAECLPGDSSDEEVYERRRGRGRGPGKRSSTPFVRRRFSSLDDVDDDDDAAADMDSPPTSPSHSATTMVRSSGSQRVQRMTPKSRDVEGTSRESCDCEKVRRANFAESPVEYLRGDSSDEEIHERGRAPDRGPGKRSTTPFVRRRLSSRDDVDDEDDPPADTDSPSTSPRRAAVTMVPSRGSQRLQRKTSKRRDVEGGSSESCDREKVRRVYFAESPVVEYFPGDSSDEEIEERGRGRDRGPGKRSATPFFRRKSSSREDDVDTDDTGPSSTSPRLATKASRGTRPTRRNSRKGEDGENVKERRVNFVGGNVDYVPGDSSDEDIIERGRGRERGPGRRSCTPFRRRSSCLSEDDGIVVCERCRAVMVLSYCNIGGVDVEPQN